jgi:hypothetical protein
VEQDEILRRARAEHDRTLAKRGRLYDDLSNGLITRQEYVERREEADAKLAALSARVGAIERAQARLPRGRAGAVTTRWKLPENLRGGCGKHLQSDSHCPTARK